MSAAEVVPPEGPAPAVPHQHTVRPNPYIVGYSGYIPGLMFQYGRTFAKAAEDCVVTFLRQQEEKVHIRQVEEERRCKSLPRMRSVRTEETERTKQTFAYALEENYPPLPGYTGHIPKVYRSSVVGRSVASATRRVREKAASELKSKEKSQSVERYQEQTASSRAKQVRHVRTQESTHTSKTQTSSVSKIVHRDADEELESPGDRDSEPEDDHPREFIHEDMVENDEPASMEAVPRDPREEIFVNVMRETEEADPVLSGAPETPSRYAAKNLRPRSAVDNIELAGQIKCDTCDEISQVPDVPNTSRTLDAVDSKMSPVSPDHYRSAVSVKESFYQSVKARTTRYESQTVTKKKEMKKSPSSSKERKSLSPKKTTDPKTHVSPKKSDSQVVPKTSPKKTDSKTTVQTSPKKPDPKTAPKTSPKKTDTKAAGQISPKKSDPQAAPKTSPKKTDSKTPVQTSPKKSDSQAAPKTSPKKSDPKPTTQTSPRKLDSKPTTQTSPKKQDPKSPTKVNVQAKTKPESSTIKKSTTVKTASSKTSTPQEHRETKTKTITQGSVKPQEEEFDETEIAEAPKGSTQSDPPSEPKSKADDATVKSVEDSAGSKLAHQSPAFESRLVDPVMREGHVI